MKHSIFTKFIAVLLCILSLAACTCGILCILFNDSYNFYDLTPTDWVQSYFRDRYQPVARHIAKSYAAEHLGNCPEDVLNRLEGTYYIRNNGLTMDWSFAIYEGDTLLLGDPQPESDLTFTYTVTCEYPSPWTKETPEDYLFRETIEVYNEDADKTYSTIVAYYQSPTYQVVITADPSASDAFQMMFLNVMYALRYRAISVAAVGLLVFSASLVYLCSVAGRRTNSDDVYPVALNRIPLDLYLGSVIVLFAVLWHSIDLIFWNFRHWLYGSWASLSFVLLAILAMSMAVVGFLFAFAAQMKTRGGLWWRKTVIFFLFSKCWRFLKWIGRGVRYLFRGIASVINMLPLVWQWVGILVLMVVIPPVFLFTSQVAWSDFWILFWMLLFFVTAAADIALLGWWVWYMGQIRKGVAIMRRGGLDHQIPTRFMFGKFREFAESLNSMAEASRLAAEQQLRSERMKTELITNVSHDIKTPLTSIINYVDLLKKPHTDTEEAQYLEVLNRQSQKLKKLIVDLMDMSKASTGNMTMELGRMDAVEAVNQALGEFSDKLALAGLQPLFRCSQETVMIRADGRLLWRVLSNLLGNTVKYAMPGTRMYVDLLTTQDSAVLSIKNISRDELNVDAAELLERFVRGDASRNTEGSGLGLNIAKSLVELQGGQMDLTVDGDLFKVTIVMPLCDN